MKFSRLLLTAALLLAPVPALAEPFTYEPETCEFKITFPEKPLIEQKCTDGEKKICSEIVTYTKVTSADTSVNFRITCNKLDEKEVARYTPEVMQETVKQLLTDANLEGELPKAYTRDGYKVAAAVSTGMRGDREILYTAQLWMGKDSMFTLEGDMSGPQAEATDKLFTEILGSMHSKTQPVKKPAEKTETKTDTAPADEKIVQPEDKYAP